MRTHAMGQADRDCKTRPPVRRNVYLLHPPFQFMEGMDKEKLGEGLGFVDAFLPSCQEVRALFPYLSPNDALERLIREFPHLKAIVIKLGADGAIGYDRITGEKFSVPAYKAHLSILLARATPSAAASLPAI
ncbi:MAG: hypothetical protein SAMD01599839_08730 [Rectinema sp.]